MAGALPLDQGAPLATRWWTRPLTNRRRHFPQFPEPRHLIGCYGRGPVIQSSSAVSQGGTTPGGERRDGIDENKLQNHINKESVPGNDPVAAKVDAEKVPFSLMSH